MAQNHSEISNIEQKKTFPCIFSLNYFPTFLLPITSMHVLSQNRSEILCLSMANTCKTDLYMFKSLGIKNAKPHISGENIPEEWMPNESTFSRLEELAPNPKLVKERFERIKAELSKLEYIGHTQDFIEKLSPKKNKMMRLNFIGVGDSDIWFTEYDSEKDFLVSWLKNAGLESEVEHLPRNRARKKEHDVIVRTLIDNGSTKNNSRDSHFGVSGTTKRHYLASEKNMIINIVSAFQSELYKMEDLSFIDNLNFKSHKIKSSEEDAPLIFSFEQDNLELISCAFHEKFPDLLFDIRETTIKFDIGYAKVPGCEYEDKDSFIKDFKDLLIRDMNESGKLFDTDLKTYSTLVDDNKEIVQDGNIQKLYPIHFIQALIYSCMLEFFHSDVTVKQKLWTNIKKILRILEKSADVGFDNFLSKRDNNESPLIYLTKHLCPTNTPEEHMENIMKRTIILTNTLNQAETVTCLNVYSFSQIDRNISDGIIVKESGVFAYPALLFDDLFTNKKREEDVPINDIIQDIGLYNFVPLERFAHERNLTFYEAAIIIAQGLMDNDKRSHLNSTHTLTQNQTTNFGEGECFSYINEDISSAEATLEERESLNRRILFLEESINNRKIKNQEEQAEIKYHRNRIAEIESLNKTPRAEKRKIKKEIIRLQGDEARVTAPTYEGAEDVETIRASLSCNQKSYKAKKNLVKSNKAVIKSHTDEIERLEGKIKAREGKITKAEGEIKDIKSKLSDRKNKAAYDNAEKKINSVRRSNEAVRDRQRNEPIPKQGPTQKSSICCVI